MHFHILGCALLSILLACPAGVFAYPIPASERIPKTSLTSQYRDGYQINGGGTVFTNYFQLQADNTWGPRQELRQDLAGVRNLLNGGKVQLAGYNNATNQTEFYGGNGQDLVPHQTAYGSVPGSWDIQYTRTFDGTNVEVDVQLQFDWALTNLTQAQQQNQATTWASEIESWWNKKYSILKDDLFWFGIVFDVTLDGYDIGQGGKEYDQRVVVHPDSGRADMGNWYLKDSAQTSAHEFGHMLGFYDEYWGGGLDTSKLAADGQPITDYRYLMGADPNTLPGGGGMKQAYYLPFMNWLDSLDEDPTQRYRLVPEPGTLFLLVAALLGFFIPRSIKVLAVLSPRA